MPRLSKAADREYQRAWAKANPDKIRATKQRWYQRNKHKQQAYYQANRPRILALLKERYRNRDKKDRRLRTYGITDKQFADLFASQGNCCALCRASTPRHKNKDWSVDHDHATGKVRGILCNPCNTGIGLLGDNSDLCSAAAAYLRRPPCT